MCINGLQGSFDILYGGLEFFKCSSPIRQSSMKLKMPIGSKSNNVPFLSLGIFAGPPSSNNVSVGISGIIFLCLGALGVSGLQLHFVSEGEVPRSLVMIVGVGFRTDMGCSLCKLFE